MDVGVTKMSSKGQVVIPADLRADLKEGDKLIVLREGSRLLLKKVSEDDKQFLEDLEFARQTEEAYRRHERGDIKTLGKEAFLDEIRKW